MTFKIRNFICGLLSLILVFSTTCYAKSSDNIKEEMPLKPEGKVKNLNNVQDVYKEEFKEWYVEAYKQAQKNAESRGIELLDMNVALEEVLSGSGNNNSKGLHRSSHDSSLPVVSVPTLTEVELDAAGGMITTDEGDIFANGVRVVSMTTYTTIAPGVLKPIMTNVYEPHSYDILRGPALYRGTFNLNDRTPLWR